MRALVASSLGIAIGIFAFSAGAGLSGSWLGAASIAVISGGLCVLVAYKRPIVALDETACSRGLKIVSGLATLVALAMLARLAVFMVAPSAVGYSLVPASQWEVHHSCLSAYYVAGRAARSVPNFYADSLYTASDDDPKKIRKARMIGPFKIDVYEYPPPFLLLPRALLLLAPDFMRLRMLWFGIGGALVLMAMLVVARFLGPVAGTRALLLSPLVWMSLPMLSTLQKGNVQAMVVAASMLAMVLFERRRWAAGGALLAFATASKLYPGLLIVYLVAQRRWRAVAWTAALGVALLALSLLDIGWAPYAAFFDHLPGLLGGEAFPAFRNPAARAINFSIPGLVFKLGLFGVPGMNFGASKMVGWAYTLVALAATVFAARRTLRDREKPLVWLAILILATLRSPFLPATYAAIPPLWLLTILAAHQAPTPRTLSVLLLVWAGLNVYWPTDLAFDPRLLAVANLVPQALTVVLAVLALRRVVPLETGLDAPRIGPLRAAPAIG
jgi:hypothetical protein